VSICPQDGTVLTLSPDQDQSLKSKFQFIREIGRGGMGVIYQARHLILKKVVAVKMLHPHLVSPNAVQRFQIEGRAASALSHPHIVAMMDMGVTDAGLPYIVMEYVDGLTLAQYLEKSGPMPIERALKIFLQVCDALAHAHSRSILHRDIKPSNIMLVKNASGVEEARVMDFGIAKLVDDVEAGTQHLTKTGETLGSPLYMSPEQARGEQMAATSDIYSFGCVMYETLAGTPPFAGKTQMETMLMHMNNPLPPLNAHGKTFSPELSGVIEKALAKNPESRYQSMIELQNDLASLHAKGGRGLGRYTLGDRAEFRLHPAILVVAAVLLLGAVSIASLPALSQKWKDVSASIEKSNQAIKRREGLEHAILRGGPSIDLTRASVGFKTGDDDLQILQNNTKIERLNLSETNVSESGLEYLKHCKLVELNLDDTRIQRLSALEAIPSLMELTLSNTKVGHDALHSIASLDNLRDLNLSHTDVADADLQYLRSSSNLRLLDLTHCRHVTTGATEALRKILNPTCKVTYTNAYAYQTEAHDLFERHHIGAGLELSSIAQAQFLADRNYLQYQVETDARCRFLFAQHRFEQAASVYSEAIKNVEIFNPHSTSLSDMYYHLGFAYANAKEPEKALQAHQKAAQLLADAKENDSLTANNMLSLATDYKDLNRLAAALSAAGDCRKLIDDGAAPKATMLEAGLNEVYADTYRMRLEPEKAVQYDKSAIEIMQKLPGPKSDSVFYYAQVSLANDYMNSRQYDVAERFLKTLLKQPAPTDWRKRQYDILVHVLTLSQKDDEAARYKQEMQKLE
jgi:tRNA A-37 threonylcarbamoyl transferase component Bud32/tetratricopeptide (TPR) repeat protein